jgi:hypothetical protein
MDTLAKRHNAMASRRLPWLRRHVPMPADSDISPRDRGQLAHAYFFPSDNARRRRIVFYLRQHGSL